MIIMERVNHIQNGKSILAKTLILVMLLSMFPTNTLAATVSIKKIYNIQATVNVDQLYSLPNTVKAVMSNGTVKNVSINWGRKTFKYGKIGTYSIKGTVKNYKSKVVFTLKVVKPKPTVTPTPTLVPTLTPTITPLPTLAPSPTLTPSPTPTQSEDYKLIQTVKTAAEFENNLYYALVGFVPSIDFVIQGYDAKTFSLDKINAIIQKEPTLDYGYSGAEINMSYYGDGSTRNVSINFSYKKTQAEMISMKAASEKKATEVLGTIITPGMTDLQKERAIHDYIINNTVYDIANYNKGTIPEEDYTDYGVLILGKAVCEGYAKAMFRLLNQAGIECQYVVGIGNGGPHAWNRVKIDGVFYNVDATFDDPVVSDGSNMLRYDYFNKTDADFMKDHSWRK